jgi:hypothetical protein
MRDKPTGFHVRHDLRPDFTYELLMLLHALPCGQSEAQLQNAAEAQGYTLRQRKDYGKMLRSLSDLAVISGSSSKLELTETGRIIAHATLFQRDLLPELIHFLYYTGYDENPNKRFSWSYRKVSEWLWDSAPCEVNRDRLVNVVTQAANDTFGISGISFSTQSVSGILHWMTALRPVCVDDDDIFMRRGYCPVETFMLALYHIYQLERQDALSVRLTPNIKEQICRICLIAPESFVEMLDQAESSFAGIQVWRRGGERIAITDFSWQLITE